ncbi:hypothetical protein LEL_10554 [Akanthomyces lecanii RCEF 1005]|uniref:Uncharacterized protein n=1 Tax=Akanthomyces lecanii RCEF 1005 TaxID=1081108 RepID=A0A167XL32_CORDF|nr:hypothetical protein LEL_10554 [Akanthomyces lecanii RCEF 1005]
MSDEWQHHILHNRQMKAIHRDARGHEPFSIRFWNALFNQDFPFAENWLVAPEQLVNQDMRSGKKRVDTTIEHFNEARGTWQIIVIHEAKREGHSAKDLEQQTCNYAKAIITERLLSELYIITTIGTKLRTWRMTLDEKVLIPLFGGRGGTSKEYLETSDPNGDYEYQMFLVKVKGAAAYPQAPTLPSTGGLLQQPASSSSSDEAMGNEESPEGTASGTVRKYIEGTGKLIKSGRKMEFTYINEKGETESFVTWTENWNLDVKSGHMLFHSEKFGQTFACTKDW